MTQPRRDIPITCTRRQFWRALLREIVVTRGVIQGKSEGRLADLGSLPDDRLALVRPIMNPSYEIFVDQAHVWCKHTKTGATIKLFPIEKENLAVFNLFNGEHTLGEIARRVSQEMSWDQARGFAHTRKLFLSLVSHLVCVPKDPPELDE